MRIITLDATNWKTMADYYHALLTVLGAPKWHGRNVNALVDSMVGGGINELEPPYKIQIVGTATLPDDVQNQIALTKQYIKVAADRFRLRTGHEVGVYFETYP